jgi:hypothetical protein|tara:strand:+ start:936 stop:1160 length:225 start_codon:yes stop_codon:yes gene_type:complete
MIKLNMSKFYSDITNVYPESLKKDNKVKASSTSKKVNINILLNRIKIEKKSETKKNIIRLILSVILLGLFYIIL